MLTIKTFNGGEIPEIWQMPNNYNNENESMFTEDESNENVDQNQMLDFSMAEINPDNMEETNTGAFEPPVERKRQLRQHAVVVEYIKPMLNIN